MVLALATVGVGYGLWSKVLTINGTIETGEIGAVLSRDEIDQGDPSESQTEPVFWEGDSDCDDDFLADDDCEVEGKDIGECTATLLEGNMAMQILITNGYPSFSCWVQFNVENTGTIPFKLYPPKITPTNFTNGLEVTVDTVSGFHGPTGFNPATTSSECYHGVGVTDLDVISPVGGATGPHEHPQLEPEGVVFCVLRIHVEQEAEQDETYRFTAEVCAHQWNEDATQVACFEAAPES